MNDGVDAPNWSDIPAPSDDGAVDHLRGMTLPAFALPATDGPDVDLAACPGRTVVYAYPRTGRPDLPNPDNWDMIPGARGCSPQSCALRDHFAELKQLGVSALFGLSTQDTAYQSEAATRLHLAFPLLSDEHLKLTRVLNLPTFQAGGMTLLKRFTLVVDGGRVTHVFYPIFPPVGNAKIVIAWLSDTPRGG